MALTVFGVAIFGLLVGSYLNVYILRLHTGKSTTGRSGCMSCGSQLTWKELVPVVSYFALRGRCRRCGSAISKQYWMVELTTALLFVLVWVQGLTIITTLIALAMVSVLVIIAVYDIRHTIIPNQVVYIFLILAVLAYGTSTGFIMPQSLWSYHLLTIIYSALGTASPLFVLWFISKGAWMGFGDVKLTLGFGAALGLYQGVMAIMLGFVLGAIVGVTIMYAPKVINSLHLRGDAKHITMKSEVPFAPFLITGFLLVFLFNFDLVVLFETLL